MRRATAGAIVGGVGRDRVPNYIFCGGIAWNTTGTATKRPQTFAQLWRDYDKGRQALWAVEFEWQGRVISKPER